MPIWDWLGVKWKDDKRAGMKHVSVGRSGLGKNPSTKEIMDKTDWVDIVRTAEMMIDPQIPAGAGVVQLPNEPPKTMTESKIRPLTKPELRILNKRVAEGAGYSLPPPVGSRPIMSQRITRWEEENI